MSCCIVCPDECVPVLHMSACVPVLHMSALMRVKRKGPYSEMSKGLKGFRDS